MRPASAHANRNLRLLQAFWFFRDAQIWIPVWIVFLTLEQGFTLTQVLTTEGIYLLAVVLLEVPTGAVADRWGRSKSLGLGAICLGVAVLAFAFATTYPILLGSFLLWALGTTLMSGADLALLFDTLKDAGREHEYEQWAGRGASLNWGGAAVATLLGGPIAGITSTEMTIYIGAATCLLVAVAVFAIDEPPHRAAEHHEPYFTTIKSAFRDVSADRQVRSVILLVGLATAATTGVHYLTQPFLIDRGLEVGLLFSWLQVPLLASGVVGGLLAGRFANRYGIRLLVTLPLLAAAGLVVVAATPGFYAFALMPLIGGLESLITPVGDGFVNRRIPSERRATVLSMKGMVHSVVMAALASSLGWLTDNPGLAWAYVACAALALAAVVFVGIPAMARRDPPPSPAAASAS
ncbi:MAG: MFS transporter [Dehalococcoidia bacterium]